ncbi:MULTISPECIES: helix-turn-helix domain-containing protein [Actinomadura]|uniref:GAF domain-containing protein n=2 Tax=Actinomadura madurae TaxID=1993 RepID=A0A1I5KIA0_9ACTN|nr:helix-turn-helix domain-containing protein [Actinomadura madurae]MCP9966538.1 helix-turn-helix domain-containing protein [Actinomadura madurae]MCP9979029.1 helix-turn-helix domain-containing protein [Actinomadura madurae]MCQ0015210.1 helix-turn-helix domain-containing protein [Actinomadura madurae]URM95364.1 helix-turn-helix domain-containing protein [Actinomadura madurae]SFO84809.1 GAF domain-containing protein [Actinomadura madurae]
MNRPSFLRLLVDGAPLPLYDEVLNRMVAEAASSAEVADLQAEHTLALHLRDTLEKRHSRQEQQRALVECAKELAEDRSDPDTILTLIVSQAQRLLGCDMAYLSLNDNEERVTCMRVMVGATSSAWKDVRIPFGAGVGGRVAATGTPFSTPDYFSDERLAHDPDVDASVRAERQVSIVGVPLRTGTVIGVLFGANRTPGPFSHDAIALLGSFADLAASAIDRARERYEKDRALTALRQRTVDQERAVAAHDQSMDIVLRGGGVQEVVTAVGDQLGGVLAIFDEFQTPVAWTPGAPPEALQAMAVAAGGRPGGSSGVTRDGTYWATGLVAGGENLGTLVWAPPAAPAGVGDLDRRLLGRAAVVASLLQLFGRNLAAAEARVRGELLDDLLTPNPRTYSSLAERALRIGYQPQKRHAVVVAHIRAEKRHSLASVASDLAAARDGLSTVRDGLAVLVIPSDDPSLTGRQISRSMTTRLRSPVTVGAAGPVDDPADLPAAYAEALACAQALLRLERTGSAATADDLGYAGLLLGDGASAARFVMRTLGPVIQHDEQRSTVLMETLDTYFATGQSLVASAKRLHIHPNTVTQRLDRVKRLLGKDWNSPDHTLEVQLALRLHRLSRDLDD